MKPFSRAMLVVVISSMAAACNSTATPDPAAAPVASVATPLKSPAVAPSASVALERKSFGSPINASVEKVELDELLKNGSKCANRTVRTEGKVSAVCQGKGCWLELADEHGQAHVKLGNHKFFVPRSSSGKHAIVEARVLPAVDTGHCEQEAVEQTGQVARIELDATGVELF